MEIVQLPSEMLLYTFSFLPANDLVRNIREVCKSWNTLCMSPELWRDLDFESTFIGVVEPHTFLSTIDHAINKLVIPPARLDDCFVNHNNIRLLNKRTLHLTDDISNHLIQTIVDRCPKLQNIRLLCSGPRFTKGRNSYDFRLTLRPLTD